MRSYYSCAALAGLLLTGAPALAQTYPAEAMIVLPTAQVYAGPSKQFSVTSELKQNDKVWVVRQSKEPGWLEIAPPAGSFSWINAKYVKQTNPGQALGIVECDPTRPVSIQPGSRMENKPPTSESLKLTQGTQVVILGQPHQVGGDWLLPIVPHATEVRYLSADAVQAPKVVSTNNSTPNWNLMPNGYVTSPLLAQADQARASGNIDLAKQLYTRVTQEDPDPNHQQIARTALYALSQPAVTPAQTASRTVMSPGNPQSSGMLMQSPAAWSAYGRLRDVKTAADNGQPLYALEDNQGKVITYVTTNPGKSLVGYNGRTVSVFGPIMYRSDAVRMQYVVATYVAVP